jgi:hypothetical protein
MANTPVVMKNISLLFVMLFLAVQVVAQKQLVLLKDERVLLRLNPGDEFVFKARNSKSITRSYVNNLSDTAIVIHRDTIPFHRLDRIYFRRTSLGNKLGAAIVVAGGALFLIDQLNFTVLQGNDPALDRGVSASSISGVIIGLPFMLMKKKYQRINRHVRVRVVKPGSAFYREKDNSFESPYIEE